MRIIDFFMQFLFVRFIIMSHVTFLVLGLFLSGSAVICIIICTLILTVNSGQLINLILALNPSQLVKSPYIIIEID